MTTRVIPGLATGDIVSSGSPMNVLRRGNAFADFLGMEILGRLARARYLAYRDSRSFGRSLQRKQINVLYRLNAISAGL